nr:MAG: class III cytochrome C domain protein [Bacteroidota bacterium]
MSWLKEHWQLALMLLVSLSLGIGYCYQLQTNVGYAPKQPIPFSHKLHAGQYKIDCLYCHQTAETSKHASIPSLYTCMGCHNVVATQKPTIQQLKEYYDRGEPIEWIRVHSLPDHAYFSHRWHVAAGVSCQTCHGPVEQMDIVRQVNRLEMGDCITCHRQTDYVPEERKAELARFDNLHLAAMFGKTNASTQCNTCHQ